MRRSSWTKALVAVATLSLCAALAACGTRQETRDGRTITVWSLENLTERITATQRAVDRFTEQTGIQVKLVGVDENQLGQLIMSSAAAGRLPDVIGAVPLAAVRQMAANDLLDTEVPRQVVQDLDPTTFNPRALELTRDGGQQLAVPSDAWAQLLVYRKDLFAKAGLPEPATYQDIERAARTLHATGIHGISLATDPGDVFTQQTFEYLALANGCQLVDSSGRVQLDSPACRRTFSLYGDLATRYSAVGTQTVESTRATYFSGGSAMIIWSSMLLDELAGLRNDVLPSCPECRDDPTWLARNSGVVTAIRGPDGQAPAQFGEMASWVITRTANTEASRAFVHFMLDEGYQDWFGMAPEGKFPVRSGTPEDPTRFQRVWESLQAGVDTRRPLAEIYPAEVIDQLRSGLDRMQRWGITQGQGALVGATTGELPVPRAIGALASGQLDAAEAAEQAHEDVTAIQQSLQ